MAHALTIAFEEVNNFAHTNLELISENPKAIVLSFHGLNGGTRMESEPTDYDRLMAEKGIVFIAPYYGPWSWMNSPAVTLIDAVVEAVIKRFPSLDGAPVISTGGSMGGLSALVYTRYARITPSACAANCPVCDLVFHRTERVDLPRTIYCAFAEEGNTFEEAVEQHSPLHLVASMPDIPYLIVHGDADQSVNKQAHSDRFVKAMREAGRSVAYVEVPGMTHCNFTGHDDARDAYESFIVNHALNQ